MDILDLLENLKIEGESFYLETLEYSGEETGFGNLEKSWSQVQEMNGIIQRESKDPEERQGLEEQGNYKGFFHGDFDIPQEDSGKYRINNTIVKNNLTFVRYFRIKTIDRNLRLDNSGVYCEMTLELAKKW